ncbi:hypothetical protein BC936DRAFT_146662 [Jimgerdemannia flammicorona]|uniref:Uncharacterized protein n=1 Tax=Jimgerdemannia flammicorona TaxID=994334 RepID=A0A433D722_9FUNG|nr:hypothetical protein BC936DRAFT_146662 [Jimgerdemannia flammicorona]
MTSLLMPCSELFRTMRNGWAIPHSKELSWRYLTFMSVHEDTEGIYQKPGLILQENDRHSLY